MLEDFAMSGLAVSIFFQVFLIQNARSYYHDNFTEPGDPASRQIIDFKRNHAVPIGLQTSSAGEPIEVRDTITLNSDLISNQYLLDLATHLDAERIPERVVHAKGIGAFGYFEVTNDVSKYTSADVFNGIGKKTPLVVRFSSALPSRGGSELIRDIRGLAVKFYTNEGNLDMLCLQIPVYLYRDPIDFPSLAHARRRNPRTNLLDNTMFWDLVTLRPSLLHSFLWVQSDYGSPRGYRKMNAFPIHTYEISNKNGEKFYVKFNYRTEQGLANFTNYQNMAVGAEDPDYYPRDLYNAIAEKNYPSWRLEMDIMTLDDIKKLDYNPFDLIRQWKRGTYHTVEVGRLVLDRTVENNFKDAELSAFNPGNLVPGIPGPVDFIFKTRRFAYRDTQNYRLGRNHNKIEVNTPKYAKTYNRDGVPPVGANMKDAPNYYPNSFNGPIPYVDAARPDQKLIVLESASVDLEPTWNFYNHVLESEAHRQRVADHTASSLESIVDPTVLQRALKLLMKADLDLGKRVRTSLRKLRAIAIKQSNEERYDRNAQCLERNMEEVLMKHEL